MDLLTHIAAGAAVGTTIAVCVKGKAGKKAAVVCAGALGGALPDIDAISLWSKFDATFGRLFGLSHAGKEIYSAKFWYSHHAFMHSLAACVLLALILLVVIFIVRKGFKNLSWAGLKLFSGRNIAVAGAFASGYIAHLICDMPTPASSWGGVNILFPLEPYIGGWGKIWWWNNYDIFLIISAVIAANLLILALSGLLKRRSKQLSCVLLAAAVVIIIVQVNSRGFDFNSHTYQQCETKSKEIQKKILGEKLYKRMEKLDNAVPIYF